MRSVLILSQSLGTVKSTLFVKALPRTVLVIQLRSAALFSLSKPG